MLVLVFFIPLAFQLYVASSFTLDGIPSSVLIQRQITFRRGWINSIRTGNFNKLHNEQVKITTAPWLLKKKTSHSVSSLFLSTKVESEARTTPDEKSRTRSSEPAPQDWKEQVLAELSNVIDPDLNADIVTLKFVKNIAYEEENSTVKFDLELTTPACPVKDQFVSECRDLLVALPFINDTEITLTSQPTRGDTSEVGLTKVSSIIAVSSCKGGVGKSTTAVNLAYALKSAGARVGIFDADIYGPSLPTMVSPDDDAVRFVGRQICPLERDGVKLMSFGYVNDGAAVMRGPMVSQLLDQFLSVLNWGELDYLILDMPPGTGDIQLTLSQRLNITAAVIVTTPQELSFADVVRGIDMFDSVNVPCVAVVENMAYYEASTGEDGVRDKPKDVVSSTDPNEDMLRAAFVDKLRDLEIVDQGTNSDSASMLEMVAAELVRVVQKQQSQDRTIDHGGAASNGENSTSDVKERIQIFGPGHAQRLSKQYGIDHVFSVPLLDKIAESGDSGVPFVTRSEETADQTRVFRDLATAVIGEVAKTKFSKSKSRLVVEFDNDRHLLLVDDRAQDDKGRRKELPPAALRRECKCAACVEEMTGRQILNKQTVSDLIKPTKIDPCGNYALSVNWSDGHKSLYPYRQIRALLNDEVDGNAFAQSIL